MPATLLSTVLWNFASALVGGFIGGIVTAYAIGRWRGEIDQRVQALQDWRAQVDDRLERGNDQLVSIPVVETKIEEISRSVELLRDDIRTGMADMRRQIESSHERFVLRAECDRQHHRSPKA